MKQPITLGAATLRGAFRHLHSGRKQATDGIDRRSALSLGLLASAVPLLAFSSPARAVLVPNYSPTDGEDIGGGRRLIEVGTQASHIPAYSSIQVIDVVFQPGAADPRTVGRWTWT